MNRPDSLGFGQAFLAKRRQMGGVPTSLKAFKNHPAPWYCMVLLGSWEERHQVKSLSNALFADVHVY